MCGIIGYVGQRACKPLLLQGLERLEYRGYDSAGIALLETGGLDYVRAVGNLQFLKDAAGDNGSQSSTGLGHTRWATHGRVSEENAHPLTGCDAGKLAIVLNGIVENYRELKQSLVEEGHNFSSETDAEVVVHLIERAYTGRPGRRRSRGLRAARGPLRLRRHPPRPSDELVGARRQCPLVVGVGEGEMFLASSIAAFLRETKRGAADRGRRDRRDHAGGRTLLRPSPTARSSATRSRSTGTTRAPRSRATRRSCSRRSTSSPRPSRETIGDRIRHGRLELEDFGLTDLEMQNLRRIVVLACGTAYHAGVVGRYVIEEWARLPVEPDIASEWRYRNPVLSRDTLVIGISQSGETADTLAAMRLARQSGARTLAITNMMGTQITREVESVLYTRAGLEMGVAATKTFTAQVALFYLIALKLAEVRKTLPDEEIDQLLAEVESLPDKIAEFLDGDHPIEEVAQRHYDKPFFLYLGRHIGLPVCLEGALKLKEISYIPTEAYSAGEMKHGPIALLDEQTPVVCVATDSHVYDKVVSNIQETRARGAEVIAIATDGNEDIQHHADDVIYVPRTHPFLQAALAVVPLQLLAYRIARLRGLNVDQPRNLAKTVTVE